MKLKVLTIATHTDLGLEYLVRSLQRNGYDFDILGMGETWPGFGFKIFKVHEWCENHREDYTHVMLVDAFDVMALAPMPDVDIKGVLFSAEKACWPDAKEAENYPANDSAWKYLNSGSYIGEIDALMKIFNEVPFSSMNYDQLWWTKVFLSGFYDIRLDYNCEYFQSIAFRDHGDYKVENGSLFNLVHSTCPFIIHGNGKTDMSEIYATDLGYYSLKELQEVWKNSEEYNVKVNKQFESNLLQFPHLNGLRVFVEQNVYGFGERSFYYMWKLIIQEMPVKFSFLEIGVFRGQTLVLVSMLSEMLDRQADITGLTPLDSTGGHWVSDYQQDIETLHGIFHQKQPTIIKGLSTDKKAICQAGQKQYDIVYIDGGHTFDVVQSDLEVFPSMVKKGGILVIDDCCNSFQMPFGYFTGIADVSRAVDKVLPPVTDSQEFEFLFNVVHNRVYRKL